MSEAAPAKGETIKNVIRKVGPAYAERVLREYAGDIAKKVVVAYEADVKNLVEREAASMAELYVKDGFDIPSEGEAEESLGAGIFYNQIKALADRYAREHPDEIEKADGF